MFRPLFIIVNWKVVEEQKTNVENRMNGILVSALAGSVSLLFGT